MSGPRLAAAVAVAFAAVWLLALPTCWTIFDEQAYLTAAGRFAAGAPFPLAPLLGAETLPGPRMVVDALGREVPEFALGWPLLLAPTAAVGPVAAFALVALLHLLGAAAFAGALGRLGLSPRWALLYLLHPTAVLFSRTAMADVPVMAASAAGLYLWLDRARPDRGALLAGLMWGASLHLRWSQGAVLVALVVAALWTDRTRGRRRAPGLLLGLAPGVLTAVGLAVWLHGAPLPPRTLGFGLEHLASHLPLYALWLLLLYPGLILAPARPGPLRAEAVGVLGASLLLFGAFEHQYSGFGLGAPVIGLRFFLPATVFLLPAYAHHLSGALSGLGDRLRRTAATAGIVALTVAAVGLQARHAGIQEAQRVRVDAVAAALLSGTPVLAMNDARELLLDPPVPVIPWFGGEARLDTLPPEVQLLSMVRADRPTSVAHAEALQQLAAARWELSDLLVLPPDGATPGVRLQRARRRN